MKAQEKVNAQLLYSYYNQDGDNAAVTGGTGTQKLDYHGPAIAVYVPIDSITAIQIKGGIDVYSSASTDNIDFQVSSASATDARSHFTVGLSHTNKKKERTIDYHGSFSIESDYTSGGLGANYTKGYKNYTTVFSAGFQVYFDDCRWGRLSNEKQLVLIYPVELRGVKDWETEYLRQTYALSLSLSRILRKRLNGSIFMEPTVQNGLLATTFHRIYYSDNKRTGIEKLPNQRFKFPIGFRLNYFFKNKTVWRSYYRFYTDNWNVTAHTTELEIAYKYNRIFTFSPFYRFHTQSQAFWFKPYGQHFSTAVWATSDYDLSAFVAHKFGLGLKVSPLKGNMKYFFRGGQYLRSDGLRAFFVSVLMNFEK